MLSRDQVPLVSIVVLNWNGKRFIDPFMQSFVKLEYPRESLELLFVDNASSDDSVSYLKKRYSDVLSLRVVQNDNNYGYAGGNNLGIHQATGEYVLVCNNDLEFDPRLINELLDIAKKNSSAATVPKLMYLNKPGLINNAGSRLDPSSDWPIYEEGANQLDEGQYDSVREISAFCGACVLFSRKFLQHVGLFDSKFFMYFEDGDLSWRGQKAGYKFFYAPRAVAFHYHTGSSKEGSPLFNHYVGRNRVIILAKNARLKVFLKGYAKTVRDHFMFRLKNLFAAVRGKYNKRLAWQEFLRSQKILISIAWLLPYAALKRIKLIKEDTL